VTTPVFRQTPLFHAHERTGAILIDHHGWQIPTYFTDAQTEAEQILKTAGLSDLSWMTKLDLKGYGLKTPPAVASGRAWRLAPEHYLITCEPPRREAILANISSCQTSRDLFLPAPVYITDVTSVYAQFLLAGPRSREILRKLTSLNVSNLDNLHCGQASLAHVHCVVLRDDLENMPAFHLLVSREYGESVWDAVMQAGNEFQFARFGLAALKGLGGAG
jgi:sarcosine oxidase subunit alpha